MKTALLLAILSLGGSTAAYAAPDMDHMNGNVPLCSRTLRDNCMNPSQAHHEGHHRAMTHHGMTHHGMSHHRTTHHKHHMKG